MSKKNNNNNKKSNRSNISYHREVDLPDIINMDELAYVSDDDLDRRHNILCSERERIAQMGVDPVAWEIEISYVQREMKIRNARRNAHERFIKSNPDSSFYFDESNFQSQISEVGHVN